MPQRRLKKPPSGRSRMILIAEADILFARAKHYVARASVSPPPQWFGLRAAHTFEEAAHTYKVAGLTRLAGVLYGYARECYDGNGRPREASRCAALEAAVAEHWEGGADE